MKILVIGSGGREHALAWKLQQSPLVTKIWCAPGNGGISQHAECVPANLADIPALGELAERLGVDLTVVGPEQPLVDGIVEEFERRDLKVVGPSRKCAQLEGSKIFAKEFLNRHAIPTAATYGLFDLVTDAIKKLGDVKYPVVLKADGLCGGKGVLVAKSYREAADFADRVLEKREFGDGGGRLLIEEALEGKELSFIVLGDGSDFVPLLPTRDHKRVFDGDGGPNTGGMGAYSCDGIVSAVMEAEIRGQIVEPTFAALERDGCAYLGFLYFGLMLTSSGPKVLEFNCRLGDPETQAIVARMDFDLAEVLSAMTERELANHRLNWRPGASVCVVLASGGYPGNYASGKEIHGLEAVSARPGVSIFHAGTKRQGEYYYTSSGRVLGVTAVGDTLAAARRTAYHAVESIEFADCHYRRDIALGACLVANAGES
jgi:phosphoribosylamine---glycine ligase